MRVIRRLSTVGLAGTPDSAALAALLAATTPHAGGRFFGLQGPGNAGGAPGKQALWPPLLDVDGANRLWSVSQEMVGVDVG